MNMRQMQLSSIAALLMMSSVAGGDTINLKSAVRLKADDAIVQLSDIAVLEGEHAEALADLEIGRIGVNGAVIEITVRSVRAKLEEAGVHWGRIQLNGRKVTVRPGRAGGDSAVQAMQAASLDASAETRPRGRTKARSVQELMSLSTLRGAIAQFIADGRRGSAADIRIAFDRNDADILNRSRLTHRIEIDPMGSLRSDRLGLNLRLWSGASVVDRFNVTIGLTYRETITVASRDIARNEMILEADVQRHEKWMKSSELTLAASPLQAIGRIATRRIKAGQVIRSSDVTRQTLIRRGDFVIVRCLVGGAVISLQAEARQDGSEGQTIEFRKRGERDTFLATISAPGEAIIDLSKH